MSILSRWIGAEGAAFERVSLVMTALGYEAPRAFADDGAGNYAVNIIDQYESRLGHDAAVGAVRYALAATRDSIRYNPPTRNDVLAYAE